VTVNTVSTTAAAGKERCIALWMSVSARRNSEKLPAGKGMEMEVKINREIRNYTESMFFGLSLRQFVFSLLAVAVAVGLYFGLKPYVGTETVSWMCILGAAPFAAMGFITYNGMTAEQFVWAWIRSELLEPKQIKFEPVNIYYEALKSTIDAKEKEVYKGDDKEH
jgi:hypothetical protein